MLSVLAMNNEKRFLILVLTLAAFSFKTAQADERFPRHNFAPNGRALTEPSAAPKNEIAAHYVKDQALAAGLALEDVTGLYLVKSYRTDHNGIQHFVYRQQFDGIDVWNSDFTVNVDADGRILNSGGQLY